jgi:hypothetical protein
MSSRKREERNRNGDTSKRGIISPLNKFYHRVGMEEGAKHENNVNENRESRIYGPRGRSTC